MENVIVILTKDEQQNLLMMLDAVQVKGIQSAQTYLHIVSKIQNAKINDSSGGG